MPNEKPIVMDDEPIHLYFGLSYAHYLVLPRTALQSMPIEWQRRFVDCLRELGDEIEIGPEWPLAYWVTLKHLGTRRYASLAKNEPLPAYDKGRARVELNSERKKRENKK